MTWTSLEQRQQNDLIKDAVLYDEAGPLAFVAPDLVASNLLPREDIQALGTVALVPVTPSEALRIAAAVERSYRTACGRKGRRDMDRNYWDREAATLKNIAERFREVSDAN